MKIIFYMNIMIDKYNYQVRRQKLFYKQNIKITTLFWQFVFILLTFKVMHTSNKITNYANSLYQKILFDENFLILQTND